MKSAPLILVSPSTQRRGAEFSDYSLSLSDAYPQAIITAGGIPWIMSCTPSAELVAESVRRCDGVMLTGGDDIQLELYASNPSPRLRKTVSAPDLFRDLTELLLIDEVFRQRKSLLAICRGQQILNAALGGTLVVDIASQEPRAINHSRTDLKDKIVHEISLIPDSLMFRVFGRRTLGVNSSHHQAVCRVTKLLRVTATSTDGTIEALELSRADSQLLPYLLAVQFHPERLVGRHPEFLELFRSFILACAPKYKRSL